MSNWDVSDILESIALGVLAVALLVVLSGFGFAVADLRARRRSLLCPNRCGESPHEGPCIERLLSTVCGLELHGDCSGEVYLIRACKCPCHGARP